jgi:hypothetical protein
MLSDGGTSRLPRQISRRSFEPGLSAVSWRQRLSSASGARNITAPDTAQQRPSALILCAKFVRLVTTSEVFANYGEVLHSSS